MSKPLDVLKKHLDGLRSGKYPLRKANKCLVVSGKCICPIPAHCETDSDGNIIDYDCIIKGRGHQRRLKKVVVAQVKQILGNQDWTHTSYRDFEDLYDQVRKAVNIKGIGDLTIYDIAVQIGKCCNPAVLPKKYVYLAQGALEGAKMLLGAGYISAHKDHSVSGFTRIDMSHFAPYFSSATALDIEEILCIYKSLLKLGGLNGTYASAADVDKAW